MGSVWGFLKRQFNTKTGKGAIGTIVTTATGVALGAIAPAVGVPVIINAGLIMLLKDPDAKKQEKAKADGE
jgi:F0F1-type ATP synthase membrane subunit c/vacuolar-type H+-ATPase subunit K